MTRVALVLAFVASVAVARPKPMMMEFRSLPSAPKALAKLLTTEKPGAFRDKALDALETKLREKGEPLDDPDAVDAMTRTMFDKIFDDMAAETDIWVWQTDDSPRGDVLVRETVKLLPGQNSTSFAHEVTVSPKGKRIDRGYLNTPCTVKVSVAKSEADWFLESESRGHWVAHLHPVKTLDGVTRVVISLLSPGRGEPPAPRHERPIWLAYFWQDAPGGPWDLLLFQPAASRLQKQQEVTLLPPGEKLSTDSQRQLVLSLRMEDVRLVNPARKVVTRDEQKWLSLEGLTTRPVDARHVAWLEPWRSAESPMQRAVAVLRIAQLGGKVSMAELLSVLESVKAVTLQGEALGLMSKLIDATQETPSDEDRAALAKLPDPEIKVREGVARIRSGTKTLFYKKGDAGWEIIKPGS